MLYEFDNQQLKTPQIPNLVFTDLSDEFLMARVVARDPQALETLRGRHGKIIRSVIYGILKTDADVDDALQEFFIEVWNQASHYNVAKGKAMGWMITMARRRAIDRLRRNQTYQSVQERFTVVARDAYEGAQSPAADDETASLDLAEIFREVLAELPPAQREAIQMAFYKGLSQREIAAKTGVALGTIKTRIELGLHKIKKAIQMRGGTKEFSLAA